MNIIQLLQRQKGINMQERTLYQEIVKQCMIQERHDALLESDKEKGIERTEEKLLEELEKIKEKCHAVTSARKVQTLIEDYSNYLGYITAAAISFGSHFGLTLKSTVGLLNAICGQGYYATVKEELLKSRFTKKDMVVCALDVLDQLYLYDRMLNGGPLIFRGTELWEENKKYLNYLMPIVEKLELDIQVSDLESEYQKTVTI